MQIQPAGGGGLTRWKGATTLYVNLANNQRSRYKNRMWREHDGGLAGRVLLTWYPGRGQQMGGPALSRLLAPSQAVALLCRRLPGQPYIYCGALRPVALGLPAALAEQELQALPVWTLAPPSPGKPPEVAHVIWELCDEDALMHDGGSVKALFGKGGLAPLRPSGVYSMPTPDATHQRQS